MPRQASGKTHLVYLIHNFYSPIDEEIEEFLAWLQPRAANGTVVKTIGEVLPGTPPTGNQPPVAAAGPAQTVPGGSTVQLDGAGSSDVNGDPLTYQWTQTAGTHGHPVQPHRGQTHVHRTARPLHGDPPPGRQRRTGQQHPLHRHHHRDQPATGRGRRAGPDSARRRHRAARRSRHFRRQRRPADLPVDQTAGTPVTLSNNTASSTTFTAPASPATLTFRLVVNDGQVSSTPSTVTVTVTGGPNQPPVAAAGPAQTVPVGATVQLDGAGSSDVNGDPLTYQWTQTAGTPVTLSNNTASETHLHRTGQPGHPDLPADRQRRTGHQHPLHRHHHRARPRPPTR